MSGFNDKISSISQQDFYKFLSYSTRRMVNELLDLRDNIELLKKKCLLSLAAFIIIFIYVSYFLNRYFFYIFPRASSITYVTKSTIYLDILIITLMIIELYRTYTLSIKLSKTKKSFDDLRNTLIKTINAQFCSHDMSCKCKQSFIKYMDERENINLSF